jgi:cyclopropane fatty-acyl-phospholipid synthase-like methyltransferase
MATFWDERFGGAEYFYGTAPNVWLAAQASRLKPRSRILSLGEGEGRNGVWLATQGHRLEAVDGSSEGMAKAQRLAASRGVTIRTTVADLTTFEPERAAYDAVVMVFVHLAPPLRQLVLSRAQAALRPGGLLIVEFFTPRQLAFTSGGPKEVEALFEPASLRQDLPGISWEVLREEEIDLDEGPHHRGRAAVVRGLGVRTAR